MVDKVKSMFDDVGEFHSKFKLPMTDGRACGPMSEVDYEYRIVFMAEELKEFVQAYQEGNLADQLDALVDLAWVAMGTAHYLGAPFNEAWAEVVKANMAKVRGQPGDGGHKRGAAEPIRKPEGWKPPDILGVISRHNTRS